MEKFNFKPKQWVLVRDEEDEKWALAQFSNMGDETFVVIGGIQWDKCIPYEGNEHLLGTTDDYVEPYVPKDGDFVYIEYKGWNNITTSLVFIKKEGEHISESYVMYDTDGCRVRYDRYVCENKDIRIICFATEEEKQQLLDALHKEGKDWDESKKEIVEYRWKPVCGEKYWVINTKGMASTITWDDDFQPDTIRYEIGNCFRTEAEAQAMADKIKEVLKGD